MHPREESNLAELQEDTVELAHSDDKTAQETHTIRPKSHGKTAAHDEQILEELLSEASNNRYYDKPVLIFAGGAGEIGNNCTLLCYQAKVVMVDLGLGFAEQENPGVEVMLPKLGFLARALRKHPEAFMGIIVTHAHEDHIGGLPYLYSLLKYPKLDSGESEENVYDFQTHFSIYATKFTAEVLHAKFKEFSLEQDVQIEVVDTNGRFALGPFAIEMVGITHSIPEMQAVKIKTGAGTIFFTGDWKLDNDPVVGDVTNEQRLAEIGQEGVLAMVGDSTNIFTPGSSGSEGDLARSLEDIIRNVNKGMIVVTTFASNIARLYTIAKAASTVGRKVALLGRALWRLYQAAINSGFFMDMPTFLTMEEAKKSYKRDEILLICTGCQGEPMAAISRMANGTHPEVNLHSDDTIIFSSKVIPGNEKRIFNLLNSFVKMGVEVLTEKDHFVHVSGHPARDEVAKMYSLIKPRIAVPVHGEAMHLHEHCKFARERGIHFAMEVENGDVLCLDKDMPAKISRVDSGYLMVDGNYIIDETSLILKERRELQLNGVMVIFVVLNKNGVIIRGPRVNSSGLLSFKDDKPIFDKISEKVRKICEVHGKKEEKALSRSISRDVARIIRAERGKSPYVMVQVEKLYF